MIEKIEFMTSYYIINHIIHPNMRKSGNISIIPIINPDKINKRNKIKSQKIHSQNIDPKYRVLLNAVFEKSGKSLQYDSDEEGYSSEDNGV
jgi:hypothetical protein